MKTAVISIKGISPYSPSKHVNRDEFPKGRQEPEGEYEKRIWRERIHADPEGHVLIPPMCFKNGLTEAAGFLGLKYKGQRTYGKIFESGVMVLEPLILGHAKAEVQGEWLFVPSDGKRGGSKRVMKCFAKVFPWGGDIKVEVINEAITKDILEQHAEAFGQFIGVGRFRPSRNGYYGRFVVENIKIS
jgi:hypothetical protein